MENGITIAGSSFVDHNKTIDEYPEKNMLTSISTVSRHLGGCVCNTALSLRKINSKIKLNAFSAVGDDVDGEYIVAELQKEFINTENIVKISGINTGFTDVMTLESTGERTFFTYEGANSMYSPEELDIDKIDTDIFHIGYIFLLKKFDELDAIHGTVLAKTLKEVQSKGIKTSIDLVSKKRHDFSDIVKPSLQYCNYFIANEIEGGLITGINPFINGTKKVDIDSIKKILEKLLNLGVKDIAVIHSPEGGFAMDKNRKFYSEKSLTLPKKYIKSSVGAGDAFCAGMLYSIYNEFNIAYSLQVANTVAAMSLGEFDSVSGIKAFEELEEFKLSMGN